MPLMPGLRLGPYEIVSSLGAGGMGEVYRARDTSLDRDVAVKALPAAFATDPERVARFEREAKVLASLSHPNIAIVFGLERGEGSHTLVMELVEGEDLAERLARGPIASDDALAIAAQIIDALEAAHEQGIVHRDLKPANIKVRPDGTVKVLDFGLAKAVGPESGPPGSLSVSPTAVSPVTVTGVGVLLGTAAYMSPEQARGKPVDQRADIWAFGAVLYEMLTGHRAFAGEDVSLTLAAVMKSDPDWAVLPRDVSPAVRTTLRACLQKDPNARLRHISDVRLALAGIFEATEPASVTAAPVNRWKRAGVVTAIAAAAAVAAVVATVWLRSDPRPEIIRFQIDAPPGSTLPIGTPAVSPDGRRIAYAIRGADGVARLHVRAIDSLDAVPLPGTEGGMHPFWSPDGASLAFATAGTGASLKRVDLDGKTSRKLADTGGPWHGTWTSTSEILFTQGSGLARVPAQGGDVTAIPLPKGMRFGFPAVLPDGTSFLLRATDEEGNVTIRLARAGIADYQLLGGDITSAVVLAPTPGGTLYALYVRGSELVAHQLDERAGALVGPPRPLVDNIGRVATGFFMPSVGVSATGTLAYQQADNSALEGTLSWVDRAGKVLKVLPREHGGLNPDLSHDGLRAVVERFASTGSTDLWIVDLERESSSRFTFDSTTETKPIWSPSAAEIAFRGGTVSAARTMAKSLTGTREERSLNHTGVPTSWSPDGQFLVVQTGGRLELVSMTGAAAPIRVGSRNGFSQDGRISTDGRYLAFVSDESGRQEVYVQDMPPGAGQWQISIDGGAQPHWRGDGRELFFVSPEPQMMAVEIRSGDSMTIGKPRALFPVSDVADGGRRVSYDVARDGQRFLVSSLDRRSAPITVVRNWWVELAANSKP